MFALISLGQAPLMNGWVFSDFIVSGGGAGDHSFVSICFCRPAQNKLNSSPPESGRGGEPAHPLLPTCLVMYRIHGLLGLSWLTVPCLLVSCLAGSLVAPTWLSGWPAGSSAGGFPILSFRAGGRGPNNLFNICSRKSRIN